MNISNISPNSLLSNLATRPQLNPVLSSSSHPISQPATPPSNQIGKLSFSKELQSNIQNIFNQYHLGGNLCLLDILGLETIRQMKLIFPEASPQSIRELIGRDLVKFYAALLRQSPIYLPLSQDTTIAPEGQRFFVQPETIIQHLKNLLLVGSDQLKHTTRSTSAKGPTQEKLQKKMEAKRLEPLQRIVETFIEILRKENLELLLLRITLKDWSDLKKFSYFPDVDLKQIDMYLDYLDLLIGLTPGQIEAGFDKSLIEEIQEILREVNFKDSQSVGKFYFCIERYKKAELSIPRDIEDFLTGLQNHTLSIDDWSELHPELPTDCQSSKELQERLLGQYTLAAIHITFLSDIQTLIEQHAKCILPKYIPKGPLIKELTDHLSLTIQENRSLPIDSATSSLLQSCIRNRLYEYFSPLLESFNKTFIIRSEWRGFSLFDLLEAFQETMAIYSSLLHGYRPNQLDFISLDCYAHDLLPCDQTGIKEMELIAIKEINHYTSMFTMMNIFCRLKNSESFEDSEVFEIFGRFVDSLKELSLLPKKEKLPPAPPLVVEPIETEVFELPSHPIAEDRPLPEQIKKPKKTPPPSHRNKNWREIYKELRDQGFSPIRQTGSHLLLTLNGKSAQVVLPIHSTTLKLGTLQSIQYQVNEALAKKTEATAAPILSNTKMTKK